MKKSESGVLFFLFVFLVSAVNCYSQTWTWAKSWQPGNTDYGITRSICTDPSGNILTTGAYKGTITSGIYTLTCPANINSVCSYLMKYDNNGNVLWAKSAVSLCALTFSYTSMGTSVCTDANGDVLVAGVCGSSSKSTAFLAKYDPSGTLLWGRSTINGNNEIACSVSCDSSKNIYLAGVFTSSVVFGSDTLLGSGFRNYFLVKYDANGNQIWSTCNSSGSVFFDVVDGLGVSVSAEPNGNAFLTGAFTGPSMVLGSYTLTGNAGSANIFLAKYDASGNVLWATASSAATTSNNIACSVSADGIGNAYITGYYTSYNLTFGSNTIINFVGTQNMFIAKYDGSGNNLWVKNSRNNADDEIGYSVSSNSTTVLLTGSTTSVLTIGTNVYSPTSSSLGDNGFITKFDTNGNLLYGETLDDGGHGWFTVCVDKNCEAYVTGEFILQPLVIGSNTLMAVPAIPIDNPFIAKISFASICATGVNQHPEPGSIDKLYPNPNNGVFNFKIEKETATLVLFNTFGQKVYEQKISRGENYIRTHGLSKGLYHCVIFENKQVVQTARVIIE